MDNRNNYLDNLMIMLLVVLSSLWFIVVVGFPGGTGVEKKLNEYSWASGTSLMSDGSFYTRCDINEDYRITERICLHEIGHFIYTSKIYMEGLEKEFESAIESYYIEQDFDSNKLQESSFDGLLSTFPGIGNNPVSEDSLWGGYTEFYCEVYSYYLQGIIEIPEELTAYWSR